MWVPNTTRGLPAEYQEVEYIQSSGTQYIDTGYQPSSNTSVEAKFSFTQYVSGHSMLYGASNMQSGASRRCYILSSNYPNNNKWVAQIYSNTGSYEIKVDTLSDISVGTVCETKHTQQSFYLNGTLQGNFSSSPTYTVGYNLLIFAIQTGGTIGLNSYARVYYMKVYDSGTLVRDLVPCYRKSDNVIGLYDLVNDIFYTNAGTGTFTKGNDVPDTVEKQVYPAYKVHITSDLRGATLAGLQAQGWDGIAYRYNNYTLSSNGLSPSTTANDVAFLYKNISTLSSSDKIEMNITGNITGTADAYYSYIGYTMNNTLVFPAGFGSSVRAGYKSAPTLNANPKPIAYNNDTALGTEAGGGISGNLILNVKLDLSTGLLEYKLTGPKTHTTSATLTSAQLTNVITYKNIGTICQCFPSIPTIYTVELIVK